MSMYVIQTLMGALGSVGFALLFRIRGRKLIWAGIGGAMSWAAYLVCFHGGLGVFLSLFLAPSAAAVLSEVLARVVKAPVLMLLVPMLVPMIPGGDLYAMMSRLVVGAYEELGYYSQLVLTEAGAIALGIICTASLTNILNGLRGRLNHEKRP